MKKVVSIVGARPQFIKASIVSRAIRKNFEEIVVHTGQHYDANMSPIFFKELEIPEPSYNLGIGGITNLEQVSKMLPGLEKVLLAEKPDLVLVYGDTNSTLAGALVVASLGINLGHVEAGLRSYNRQMPEEINRVLADHLSQFLFAPSKTAVANLRKEGVVEGVFLTGDVMYDACLHFFKVAQEKSKILEKLKLRPSEYFLATVHRAANTEVKENLGGILKGLETAREKIIFPLHPRTKNALGNFGLKIPNNVKVIEPVGYLDNLVLQGSARKIITDSGGMQKEAYFLKIPCITLRTETEWVETVEDGWNKLVGTDPERIRSTIINFSPNGAQKNHYGDGKAAEKIVKILTKQKL